MSGFTLVFYYIPEDKDELTMPNAFAVQKEITDITLADIETLFLAPKLFQEWCVMRALLPTP